MLDNPEYYKKERMGKWTGNIPKSIWLYETMGDELWVPFGCIQKIWSMCVQGVPWRPLFAPIRPVKYESSINLYPYQKTAVEKALKAKNGILVMPCGSGKTQCGLEVIARIGGKALWLTHTQDLLNQSKGRAESVLGLGGYGTITGGKVNIGERITFATVQTMAKLDLLEYKDAWDIIIVDEAQHCAGSPTRVTQFYKVISRLSARYKFGLTATPKRADGLEKAMFALLGRVIHMTTKEQVAHTTCPVFVKSIETGYTPDYNAVLCGDGTIDYSRLVDDMIHDQKRFEFISDKIKSLDGSAIVLANRVEYLKRLHEDYPGRSVCLSILGNSKAAKMERKNALAKLENGEIDCIFATYQLAKEGLDVPSLKYVVFATPEKDPTTIEQSTGRVGRKANGKSYGTVIDFVDDFGMYKGWWKKRLSVYKKIGCDIIE